MHGLLLLVVYVTNPEAQISGDFNIICAGEEITVFQENLICRITLCSKC